MKTLFLLGLLFASFAHAALAEETLLAGNTDHGWSVSPAVKFTAFDDDFAVLAGGEVSWIINHSFALGAGAYGLTTEHHPGSVLAGYLWTADQSRTEMGYAGMTLRYVGLSDRVLHPTFDLLIGGGELDAHRNVEGWYREDDVDNSKVDGFFVLEPSVNAEINIVRFMRADVGAGYRFVSGITEWSFSNGDVGGPSVTLMLKFGRF